MKGKTKKMAANAIYHTGEAVGDAWSWLILREAIYYGATRFTEFQRNLGIARETLARRLAHLARARVLERRAQKKGGLAAEYVLTEKGRDFFVCLAVAKSWGDHWFAEGLPREPEVIHKGCGGAFEAYICCSECSRALKARDVTVESVTQTPSRTIDRKRQRAPNVNLLEKTRASSIARTLRFIGDRWSSLIIRECFLGTRRFDEFIEHLGVAPNILTNRFIRVVALGALERQPYRQRPLRYEYRLTKMGLDLYPVPLAILSWGERWLPKRTRRIVLKHKSCGKRFSAVMACDRCAQPTGYDDIMFARISPPPLAGPSARAPSASA